MLTQIAQTATIEVVDLESETQAPMPIRIIRQGQWVILQSEAELTDAECRSIYVAAFSIYG